MKQLFELVKNNYSLMVGTIVVYQIILCIFFFSLQNLRILGILVILIAAYTIAKNYKDKILGLFKKK